LDTFHRFAVFVEHAARDDSMRRQPQHDITGVLAGSQ